jgi:hypothetical protein
MQANTNYPLNKVKNGLKLLSRRDKVSRRSSSLAQNKFT